MDCSLTAMPEQNREFQWHNSTITGVEPPVSADQPSQATSAGEGAHSHALVPVVDQPPPVFYPREAYSQHLIHSLKSKIADGKRLFDSLEEEMQILDHNVPIPAQLEPAMETPTSDLVQTGPSDWLKDLQLLKHYLTTAYLSFCQDERLAPLWQHVIPECAFSHVCAYHLDTPVRC